MVFNVSEWLAGLPGDHGLARYADALVDAGFDSWSTLQELDANDCTELGIRLGHRKVEAALSQPVRP